MDPASRGAVTRLSETQAPEDLQRWNPRRVEYGESSDDEEVPEAVRDFVPSPPPPAKRRRLPTSSRQGASREQLAADTALAVDLSPDAIGDQEVDVIPPGASEAQYVRIRNQLLSKWRADVSKYLSEEDATFGLPRLQRETARAAWAFLDMAGLINFGVSPHCVRQPEAAAAAPKGTVIVIGAGLAGLAAAQHLKKLGYKPVVLEGHGRPGGRVYTRRLEGGGACAVADLGGSVLTGVDGNPLAVLAKQLRIPMYDIDMDHVKADVVTDNAKTPIYEEDGTIPPHDLDSEVERAFNSCLEQCDAVRERFGRVGDNISVGTSLHHFLEEQRAANAAAAAADPGRAELWERLVQWHIANLEFANAACVRELSARSWDQDDPHELQGPHCFLPGGNIRLVAALTQGVDILYNSRVERVCYSQEGVAVATQSHVFKGDAVLVTVPLGVLKREAIQFSPPLGDRKLGAIRRMGFGLLNKIILLFPWRFWGEPDMFGHLAELGQACGEYFLFYSYDGISGGAVLAGLVSGDAAYEFEKTSTEAATRRVMGILCGIFEPQGIRVPPPLQVCCTRWGQDELTGGSYSSMAVGTLGGEDYDLLAESVGGRLFFAGEATNRKYPATMHGAFLSGQREAANIAARLGAPEDVEPGLDSPSNRLNGHGSERSDGTDVALTEFLAQQLSEVFEDPDWPPDVEFGHFAAVAGPAHTQHSCQLLLRVDVGMSKSRASHIHLYVVIQSNDLLRLQDVEGGPEAQFQLLASIPETRLVGRQHLSAAAKELVTAILKSRGLPALPHEKACQRKRPAPQETSLSLPRKSSLTWAAPLVSGGSLVEY